MMLLSFGVRSRCTMEVRVRKEAALMSWEGGEHGVRWVVLLGGWVVYFGEEGAPHH